MSRPPLRLISIAWGESYVDTFLELCLPALLAPGNLPALAEHFSIELVFLTESRFFDKVLAHPAIAQARRICNPILRQLDDLVATPGSYGMSLTYAFFRGFQDLGSAMTDRYMVFIHADFILADGSYRRLLPYLLRGERLVFSPSYCTIAEDVQTQLERARTQGGTVLAVAPRAMADLIIRNRHYTVRAKTVNQRFFHLSYTDQFYGMADESTIAGHQLPMAVVAMKPERPLEEVTSYWDYGVIAEFCPSMKHVVLGDSDEFLMMELRTRDTAKRDLELGWPDPAEIARGLATFITDYKKDLGRAQLTLHSRDLPAGVGDAHASLALFLESVYAKLPEKLLPHLAHPQWGHHIGPFQTARSVFARDFPQISPPTGGIDQSHPLAARSGNPGTASNQAQVLERVRMELSKAFQEMADNAASRLSPAAAAALSRTLKSTVEDVNRILEFESERAVFICEAIDLLESLKKAGSPHPAVGMPRRASPQPVRAEFARRISKLKDSGTEVSRYRSAALHATQDLLRDTLIPLGDAVERVVAAIESVRSTLLDGTDPATGGVGGNGGLAKQVSKFLFGASPHYRIWHWLNASTRLALVHGRAASSSGSRVLVLQSATAIFNHVRRQAALVVTAPTAVCYIPGALKLLVEDGVAFDACLIEADVADLSILRTLFDEIHPLLRPGATVVGLFLNSGLAPIPLDDPRFIQDAFPVCGPARIAYAGCWASAAASRVRINLYRGLRRALQTPESLTIAISMIAAAPLAALGTLIESGRTLDNSFNPPSTVTAVTVEIKVG